MARNVILFVGDGMGVSTVTAARILDGQQHGGTGEENLLSFETFPYTAFSKTYNTNQQVPDSAGTMTAIMTGTKTRAGMINVRSDNQRGDGTGSLSRGLLSLPELARDAGLSTGVVTTARVTHATPAATYARTAMRDWEADSTMTRAARRAGCPDIARQLLEPLDGNGHDLVFGGGRAAFLPDRQKDPEYPDLAGARTDHRDLIVEWQTRGGRFIWNREQFTALDSAASERVLALFEPQHMRYEIDRGNDAAGEPSLAEMTIKAIDILSQRSASGYFLVVEAGRIDHGHHANSAVRALTDTIALSDAVRAAQQRVGDDTLILVTADHSHVFTLGGYPTRGNPILGLVRGNDSRGEPKSAYSKDLLGETYPTLGYANGPGYTGSSDQQAEGYKRFLHEPVTFQGSTRSRGTLDPGRVAAADFIQATLVPLASETHGGEDVPVYAVGPGADHVHGVIEQNLIFRLLVQSQPALRAEVCRRNACPQTPGQAWGNIPAPPSE
jgi:alkaline phosphatase